MLKQSLVLAGACSLAIACKPEQEDPGTASASAKTSASATAAEAPAPAKAKSVRARQHLPSGCDIALEVDAQKLFENPLVGPQLLAGLVPPKDPALRAQVMADPEQASFLGFLEASKIEAQRDLETLAICMPESESGSDARYLAIIGGKFPGGLVETFRDHAPPGKQYTIEPLGKGRALFREGKWLSQGAGNVVLFGNDKDLILAARKASKTYESYDLTSARDLTVTLSQKALASLEGPANDPLFALLRRGKRVQLDVDLRAGDLKGAISLADAKAVDQFEAAIQALRSQLTLQNRQAPPAVRQMMQPTIDMLDKLQFTKNGRKLGFAVQLPGGMLESALQRMAMSAFGSGAAPATPNDMRVAMAPGQAARSTTPAPRRAAGAARPGQQTSQAPSPAPRAPLPDLPSFQLTPPSVLQGKGVTMPPQAGRATTPPTAP